jgi:hypothetical protein
MPPLVLSSLLYTITTTTPQTTPPEAYKWRPSPAPFGRQTKQAQTTCPGVHSYSFLAPIPCNKSNAMAPRAKNSLVAEGDVSVQKVKKIEPVYDYDLVTRPWVFGNPRVVTVLARPPPGAGVSVASGQKKLFQRALSEQEIINDYIARKKKQFAGEIPYST